MRSKTNCGHKNMLFNCVLEVKCNLIAVQLMICCLVTFCVTQGHDLKSKGGKSKKHGKTSKEKDKSGEKASKSEKQANKQKKHKRCE